MEDKRFDKVIEKLVEEYEINYSPDSWKRLEKKLNHEDQEDNVFDKLIAIKLANYTIPVSSGAFSKFESKTGANRTASNKALKYIAGIAASLLLLFASIAFFLKSESDKSETVLMTNKSSDKPFTVNSPEFEVTENKIALSRKTKNTTHKGELETQNSVSEKKSQAPNEFQNDSSLGISYSINNTNSLSPAQENHNINTLIDQSNDKGNFQSALLVATKDKKNYDIFDKKKNEDLIASNVIASKPDINPVVKQKIENVSEIKNNNISSEEITKQESNASIAEQQDLALTGSSVSKEKNKFYNIKLHGNPSISFINTPNDLLLNIPGYNSIEMGYNIGVGFSKRTGRSEFGTGIEFYGLSYSPKKITVSINNKSFWMDKIGYQKFGLPVFYKFYIPIGNKLELSIGTSVETQIVSNSDFRFIESVNQGGTLEKLANELLKSNDFKQTVYASKEYNKGILEGGNTTSNINLTANLGIGLTANLSPTLSLFVEPEISASLLNSKFGPNKDKFTYLNLKIGINKSFNL